jgi:hypothetical protein
MDLISELKRKQQKEPLIYESDRDGAIEDIITGESQATVPSPVSIMSFSSSISPHAEGSAASSHLRSHCAALACLELAV